VDRRALIVRWGEDLAKDRVTESYLAPRGIDDVRARLKRVALPYALTGSSGAAAYAPVAFPGTLDIYVADFDFAVQALALRDDAGVGNVRLIEAFDRVVFEGTTSADAVVVAAPVQIAADLVTLPHRSSDELDAMLDWIDRNAPR